MAGDAYHRAGHGDCRLARGRSASVAVGGLVLLDQLLQAGRVGARELGHLLAALVELERRHRADVARPRHLLVGRVVAKGRVVGIGMGQGARTVEPRAGMMDCMVPLPRDPYRELVRVDLDERHVRVLFTELCHARCDGVARPAPVWARTDRRAVERHLEDIHEGLRGGSSNRGQGTRRGKRGTTAA